MNIRCPKCKRHFEYDPSSGPARCPYEDCSWSVQQSAGTKLESRDKQPVDRSVELSNDTETIYRELTGKPVPPGETLPDVLRRSESVPRVRYIRCPVCTARIPENLDACPACGADLLSAYHESRGLRALFDVSGDITFTPKIVVFLFVFTLAAFLTFTWLLTSRRPVDDSTARLNLLSSSAEFKGKVQGVTFSQLKKEFLDPTATGFRKDAVREQYLDTRVIWTGLVREIRNRDDLIQVDLVMEQPDSRSFATLQTLAIEKNRKLLAEITRGQKILFSGKIQEFDTGGANDAFDYFRVVLKDGIILQ